MKNKKFLLAAIICVIGILAVSQLWLSIMVHPEDQIQQKDSSQPLTEEPIEVEAPVETPVEEQTEEEAPDEPQISHYFGNLTGAEWSEGKIIRLKFEDGTAFTVDHYVRLSGWNRYYNVTYQEPDQLINLTEYVEGAAFK